MPDTIDTTPRDKLNLVTIIVIAGIVLFIVIMASGFLDDGEHKEYISIRDYSNCTKANDSVCTEVSLCVHAYRACQIDHCGSEGIGW